MDSGSRLYVFPDLYSYYPVQNSTHHTTRPKTPLDPSHHSAHHTTRFSALWRMISPLIDPNTRKKIEIHGTNYRKVLDDYIGLDQVGQI